MSNSSISPYLYYTASADKAGMILSVKYFRKYEKFWFKMEK